MLGLVYGCDATANMFVNDNERANQLYAAGDWQAAFKLYSKVAEQGDADAQFNLGVMYANGEGVAEDDKQAVYWYTKAAEQGIASAQFNLGVMYANGEGVAEDYVMAHMWWNIAATNGHENARKNKDILVKKMSPSQIAKAQEMARECVAKNYKDC